MNYLSFTLSMPNNNAWNGKWSGAGRLYVVIRTFGTSKAALEAMARCQPGKSHYYNFGDGWGASVEVRTVDATLAGKLRKSSAGFCGYEWMVDSIMEHGKIFADHQLAK